MTAVASTSQRSDVAVLGLGAMGAALAEALLRAGRSVTVWNRDATKSDAFAGRAEVAASAADAVGAAPLIIVCVADNAAQTAILEPLLATLAGRTVCSMGSSMPDEARNFAALTAGAGVACIEASITSYPARMGDDSTLVFYSGDRRAYERHQPVLRAMGGAALFTGEDPGSAAVAGYAWGIVLGGFLLGVLQAIAQCDAEGVDAAVVAAPVASYAVELKAMLDELVTMTSARDYRGDQAALRLWLPVFEGLVDDAGRRGIDPTLAQAAADIVGRAVAVGWGDSQFAAVFEVLRAPASQAAAEPPPDGG